MIINEDTMLEMLRNTKNVFLLEPNYKRKYMPTGFGKIINYMISNGHAKNIRYGRDFRNDSENDLICVTTLFTYESKIVEECIDKIYKLKPDANVLIGGIFASLRPKWFLERYPKASVFVGYSRELDYYYPYDDANFWGVDDDWKDYFTVFTTRGCANKCAYCAVWRIEEKKDLWINPNWRNLISQTEKKKLMVSDNNLTSSPREHVVEVLKLLGDLKKPVLFNNGIDVKHIDEEYAELLGRIKFVSGGGLTVAFDRIEEDGLFQDKVKLLLKYGVKPSVMKAFVLYNFVDTPQEAHYRMSEVYKLGIRPYPQRYASLYALDRKTDMFIGKHWTRNLTSAFRYYWLFAGCYKKYTFEESVYSEKFRQIKMSAEDWEKWNYEKDKYIAR
jgi:uncharacterized Fe-S cluster-containing radical SAM superfamily protein